MVAPAADGEGQHCRGLSPWRRASWLFLRTFSLILLLSYFSITRASAGHCKDDATDDVIDFLEDICDCLWDDDSCPWPVDDNSQCDYCGWEYITCDDDGMANIDISSLGLSGKLPDPNDDDLHVRYLNMSNNPELSGRLESDFKKLTYLEVLDLSHTGISGEFKSSWRKLTRLKVLNLSHTQLSGSLLGDWGQMSALTVLDLSFSNARGTLPTKWTSGLANLEVLKLSGTRVQGALSSLTSPSQFLKLKVLDVSFPQHNYWDCGTLPGALGAWATSNKEFRQLSFQGQRYCGCMPATWTESAVLTAAAREANIQYVSSLCATDSSQACTTSTTCAAASFAEGDTLSFLNELARAFPSSLNESWKGSDYCSWSGVNCNADGSYGITVDLRGRGLSGSIPADIHTRVRGTAVYVDALLLGDNSRLFGAVPQTLSAAVPLLRRLDLSGTFLLGRVPKWEEFGYLQEVNLSRTSVCGGLPAWSWTKFPHLRVADFTYCGLRGELSESWGSFQFDGSALTTLRLAGNNFCGCLPSSGWEEGTVLGEGLSSEERTTLTHSGCAVTNACGNINQICGSTNATLSAANATLRFLETVRDAFPQQLSSTWTGTEYCSGTWVGVECTYDSSIGENIVDLELASRGLVGTLPQLPPGITAGRVLVRRVDVSGNSGLDGLLPLSWGALSYVQDLDFSETIIFGPIPSTWEGMTSLVSIRVSSTKVCRGIPSWHATKMPNLRLVDFSSNLMTAGFSDAFGSLGDQLTTFDISGNEFCGCLPTTWTADILLQQVRTYFSFMMDSSACEGKKACLSDCLRCNGGNNPLASIDPSVSFLYSLQEAFQEGTSIVTGGEALMMVGSWRGTKGSEDYCNGWGGVLCDTQNFDGFVLNLSRTGLGGTLPDISDIDAVRVAVKSIDLSNNPSLSGTLPSSWGKLQNLVLLDLSGTSVTSTLPDSWENLERLQTLSLARTGTCGVLPPWDAAKMVSISSIDLSGCKLSGELAPSWSDFALSPLSALNLSDNARLCSCVPDSWYTGFTLLRAASDALGMAALWEPCVRCSVSPQCESTAVSSSSADGARAPRLSTVEVLVAALGCAVCILAWFS